jgi:hypothetical protein
VSTVAARATICGPGDAVYGLNVTTASPAITASRSGKWNATCPSVCPGVNTIRGEPGTSSVPFSNRCTSLMLRGKNEPVAAKPATTGSACGCVATYQSGLRSRPYFVGCMVRGTSFSWT